MLVKGIYKWLKLSLETSKRISLINKKDKENIWIGTRVRLYNVDLTLVEDSKDHYYKYLISSTYTYETNIQLTVHFGAL